MDEKTKSANKAKGGKARAEQLSPDQRNSKKGGRHSLGAGAYTQSKLRGRSQDSGSGNTMRCAVVEQGDEIKRVIVQREVVGLLTGNKKGDLDRYL